MKRVKYSLALGEPIARIQQVFDEAQRQHASFDFVRETDYEAIRVHLLDPANGDICRASHPAWRELGSRHPGDNRHVTARYTRALAVLDVRLAAVRYAAGQPPMDDDRHAPVGSSPTAGGTPARRCAKAEIARRLRKTRQAARLAMKAANVLDGFLECDWRQAEVQARVGRLSALAAVLDE